MSQNSNLITGLCHCPRTSSLEFEDSDRIIKCKNRADNNFFSPCEIQHSLRTTFIKTTFMKLLRK